IVLIPVATMASKSCTARAGLGYSVPSWLGRKGPYVTPRTYSFSSPTKINFPRTRGRKEVLGHALGLPSRAGTGLFKKLFFRAYLSRSKPAASLKSRLLPPLG